MTKEKKLQSLVFEGVVFTNYKSIIEYGLELDDKTLDRFVDAIAAFNPHGLQNIGYVSGYYSSEKCLLIQEKFKTAHPIFGRRIPSTEEALNAGMNLAKEKQ